MDQAAPAKTFAAASGTSMGNEEARREEVVLPGLVHDAKHPVRLGLGITQRGIHGPDLQRRRIAVVADAQEKLPAFLCHGL